MGEAERREQLADGPLVVGDAEALADHTLEIDTPPAHDAVDRTIRPRVHETGQFALLLDRQARRMTLRPPIRQTVRATSVEPVDPVAQRLPIHASDTRRIGADIWGRRCSRR